MKFDWIEYLNLARYLAGESEINVTIESKHRVSISRAYFAVHNIAKNFLRDKYTIEIVLPSEHKKVIKAFANKHTDRICKKISMDLTRLKDLRTKADYEDIWSLKSLISSTTIALSFAQMVINNLARLLEPTPPPSI